MSRDHAVTRHELVRHAEVATAVRDQLVELLEAIRVEQPVDPLARGQLPGVALALLTAEAAAELGLVLEIREAILGVHAGGTAARTGRQLEGRPPARP